MRLTPTLQARFTLLIALIILAVGVAFGSAYAVWLWREETKLARESARASLEAALPAVARSAWNLDRTGIRKTLKGIARLPVVDKVWFVLAERGPRSGVVAPAGPIPPSAASDLRHPVHYAVERGQRRRLGTLHLAVDPGQARSRTIMLAGGLALVMLAMLLLIAVAARRVFATVVTRPLKAISRYLLREDLLTDAPPLAVQPADADPDNELVQLEAAINRMVSARQADVAQLREYRDHLAEKVEERTQLLKATQNELMQAEKLAALGSLVAGVSHELNTPIGNGLMLASTLAEKAPDVAEKVRGPGISRRELQGFLDETVEASRMLTSTLTRARELVQDFKSVAVDRQSAKRREFRLNDCIEETVGTIRPSLKGSSFAIALDLAEDATIDGYPGAMSQVLSNLIDNAVRHGFDGCESGTIHVTSAHGADGWMSVTVADDGNGMSPTQQRRIFDPFYTTKLGQGGSGLGMAIVHRLITETMGGEIAVTSTPGQGTAFTLHIPPVAPGDAQTASEIAAAGEMMGGEAGRSFAPGDDVSGGASASRAGTASGGADHANGGSATGEAPAWTS